MSVLSSRSTWVMARHLRAGELRCSHHVCHRSRRTLLSRAKPISNREGGFRRPLYCFYGGPPIAALSVREIIPGCQSPHAQSVHVRFVHLTIRGCLLLRACASCQWPMLCGLIESWTCKISTRNTIAVGAKITHEPDSPLRASTPHGVAASRHMHASCVRPPYPYRRTIIPRITTPAAGSHTHRSSLRIICAPLLEKNLRTLTGETSIGRHGKKYRALLNGAQRATPRPPLVSISSSGCERVDKNKKRKTIHGSAWPLRKSVYVRSAPSAAAKTMEWVKPRCPSIWSEVIPNLKPMTSRSGMTAQAAPTSSRVGDTAS
jgi:hypothetical protein